MPGLVENAGPGSRCVVKTRGLSEKHGGTIISLNYEFSSLKWEVEFLLFRVAVKINSASRPGMERVFRS